MFGFRLMHSTADTLLHSTYDWYENMDEGMLNTSVFLDLKKAFETVNHDILKAKLSYYGMQSLAVNLLSSYLDTGFQWCCVTNYLSKPLKIEYGVSQGPILGPLPPFLNLH